MKVSVVISAWNAEKYIEESINSVINQTFQDWELIIVDDNSSDNTLKIIKGKAIDEDRIKIVELNDNIGCHRTRNEGLKIAQGEFIAIQDGDDISPLNRLDVSVTALEQSGADMIYGAWQPIAEDGKEGVMQQPLDFEDNIRTMNPVCHGTVMYRKSIIGDGYEAGLYAMDYSLWQRFYYEKRNIISVPVLMCKYRVHPESTSQDKKEEQEVVKNQIIEKWNNTWKEQSDTLISVIMPTYNRDDITKAVLSVTTQLYKNWELIIVNDGGNKKPVFNLAVNETRIKYFEIEHKGLSGALNEGLKQAKGKYITFLDDDDYYGTSHLETLFNHMKENPDLGIVYGQTKAMDEKGNPLRDYNVPKFDRQQQKGMNLFCVNSVMVKKECFNTCGKFDESLKTHMDYDMWRRVCKFFDCEHVPRITSYYVQHSEMMSKDNTQMLKDKDEVMKREW